MQKVKLTKGELKKQRDALSRYERYLPTLQLKKQQLQMEVLHQISALQETREKLSGKIKETETWAGLLSDNSVNIRPWILPVKIITTAKNIAGIDIPVFESAEFDNKEYDLFAAPMWMDVAIEIFRDLASLVEEIGTIEKGISLLRYQLRITTQRVNLFEKVKIPDAEEAIRSIKIYIGDQMANAVGRSKIAKRKIEKLEVTETEEVGV